MGRVVLVYAAALLVFTSVSLARSWYVQADGTGDAPTIQAGIDSADVGDEVVLAEGVFMGDGNRDISFLGKAITVRSESDDPSLSIIDCEGSDLESHRGFAFEHEDGPDATLRGITITNGRWHEGGGSGGALILIAGATNITRCEFDSNSSNTEGGAITAIDLRGTIQYCVFAANSCVGQGGGIYCVGSESDCSIQNCTFARNLTTGPEGAASGVRCEWWSRLSMVNSIVAYSPNGVAVSCDFDSQVELTCCDIFGNAGGDWVDCIAGQLGINGNFSACPSFCNAPGGDFQLCDESPCLPGNHPAGYECGLTGAWGVGCVCGPSRTESTTWGAIKSTYKW